MPRNIPDGKHDDDDRVRNVPVPDPTTLTTDALRREVGYMLETLRAGDDGLRDRFDTRLDELNLRLQQRFEAQSKALDAALDSARMSSDDMIRHLRLLDGAIQAMMSRPEVETSLQRVEELVETKTDAVEAKLDGAALSSERQRTTLTDQVNQLALAIERANAAGQTIYLLRSEAAAQSKAVEDKIAASVAGSANQTKLAMDALTDLRAQLSDFTGKFMPRLESETRTAANTERLREIEIRMQGFPTREENAVALTAADAKFAAAVSGIADKSANTTERLAALDLRLTSRLDLATGKGAGLNAAWIYAIAFIGLIATVAGLYSATR